VYLALYGPEGSVIFNHPVGRRCAVDTGCAVTRGARRWPCLVAAGLSGRV